MRPPRGLVLERGVRIVALAARLEWAEAPERVRAVVDRDAVAAIEGACWASADVAYDTANKRSFMPPTLGVAGRSGLNDQESRLKRSV